MLLKVLLRDREENFGNDENSCSCALEKATTMRPIKFKVRFFLFFSSSAVKSVFVYVQWCVWWCVVVKIRNHMKSFQTNPFVFEFNVSLNSYILEWDIVTNLTRS